MSRALEGTESFGQAFLVKQSNSDVVALDGSFEATLYVLVKDHRAGYFVHARNVAVSRTIEEEECGRMMQATITQQKVNAFRMIAI
jgi:hypothetical protein